jgi:predicted MFS family arabinose efflux permease
MLVEQCSIREADMMDASLTLPPVDENSRQYPGWRVVGACFLVATFGWAIGFYGQSVFLAELHRLHGWPTALISTATTVFYLFSAILVALVSDAMRRFGPRRCLLAGVGCSALAAFALGHIEQPWQLYAVYALMAFGWAGTSIGAITNTLGLWFDARRGMAISLALNGASCGGVFGVPLLVAAIGHFGFATAMQVTAVVMVAVLWPVIVLAIGEPPLRAAKDGSGASPVHVPASRIRADALRSFEFRTITTAFALVLFAQVGFIVHLVTYLEPTIGRERAAIAVALMTVMAVVGRVLFSTVIDRLNQRAASAASFASQAVALLLMVYAQNEALVFFACALFGFSVGNVITLPALIVQREFPSGSFGVLVSLNAAIGQVVSALGPGTIGLLRDASGSYTAPIAVCMLLQLAAAAIILIRRPHAGAAGRRDRAGG